MLREPTPPLDRGAEWPGCSIDRSGDPHTGGKRRWVRIFIWDVPGPVGDVARTFTESRGSGPETAERDGPEAVAERGRLCSGVEDDAGPEAVGSGLAEAFEPAPVAAVDRGGGLDLDGGDLAGVVLDDEVDVLAVALIVEQADGLLGPARMLEELGERERLACLALDLVVGADPRLVGAEEMGEQPGVADVGLRARGFPGAEPGPPPWQAPDEEQLLEQQRVLLDGLVVELELLGDLAIGEEVRRLARDEPQQPVGLVGAAKVGELEQVLPECPGKIVTEPAIAQLARRAVDAPPGSRPRRSLSRRRRVRRLLLRPEVRGRRGARR